MKISKKLKSHDGFIGYLQDRTANPASPLARIFLSCPQVIMGILQSPYQIDIDVVKCWEDCLLYFTTTETYRVALPKRPIN